MGESRKQKLETSLPSEIIGIQPQLGYAAVWGSRPETMGSGTRVLRPAGNACSDRSLASGCQLSSSLPLRQPGSETNDVSSLKSPRPKVQNANRLQEDTGRPQEGTSPHTQHSKNLEIETRNKNFPGKSYLKHHHQTSKHFVPTCEKQQNFSMNLSHTKWQCCLFKNP